MIIEGTIRRAIDPGSGGIRTVSIPFLIDTDDGTYSQWGHDQMILGENVDLLEALRDAACNEYEPNPDDPHDVHGNRVTPP